MSFLVSLTMGLHLWWGYQSCLNLVYLVPFLLAPMVNMGIAAVALAIHLMPAAVYPVPDGTPSLLYAFIGTGGSLRALAVSLLCLASRHCYLYSICASV